MTDKLLTVTVPEELIEQTAAAPLDMRELLEKSILAELVHRKSELFEQEMLLQQILPANRLGSALQSLHQGKRILGLSQAEITTSDDFDFFLLSFLIFMRWLDCHLAHTLSHLIDFSWHKRCMKAGHYCHVIS